MPKRPKFQWQPGDSWEANISRAIEAQRASRDDWSAKRRFDQAAKLEAFHRKRRRAARRRCRDREAARPRRPRPALGQRRRDQILRAMQPGEWYAVPDLAALSGVPYRSVQPTVYQRLWPEGLLARAQNDVWQPGALACVPKTLWRLSAAGEAAAALARMMA